LPGAFEDLRGLGDRLDPDDAALLAYARAMILWHERHGHCGVCGGRHGEREAGHARECGLRRQAFPARGSRPSSCWSPTSNAACSAGRRTWPPGRYSTIAGFVEPGESLEEAVRGK
jgi:NAD+ diphosphatase